MLGPPRWFPGPRRREARLPSDVSSESKATDASVRTLERQLVLERQARERAEEANRRKDAFLAILSHEMRSPLNSVLTWVQVLRSDRLPPETYSQALDSIERSAKLQTRMIEDLLDTSRIVLGRLSLEPESSDLVAIIRGAVDLATVPADEKKIDLECRLDVQRLPMRADSARLQQVIGNLLSNALKFTPPGGRVTVELSCREGVAEICVTDTGSGISPDVLPYVFESFRQGDSSTTRRHSGLGLGLSIARHLVELHGGSIDASSDGEDLGARFRIRLPLVPYQGAEAAESKCASDSPSAVLRGLEVLVVDDDSDSTHALELVLAAAGSIVRGAGSVREALRLFEERPCAIVISDLAMPEEDGYELLRALRERSATVPVIAFTASASGEDRALVKRAGFALHLTKPIEAPELLLAIASVASGRAAEFARERVALPRA